MQLGFYTIASGMLTNQRELDVIGNNLVNIQTPGYRADRLNITSFEKELLKRKDAYGDEIINNSPSSLVVLTDEVVSNFSSGRIEETTRELDMAINGEGFFNILAEDETVYLSRNGQFDIDEEGFLVLPGHGRVLGEGGEIEFDLDNTEFFVDSGGTLYDMDGREIDKILVTIPPEDAIARKATNGLFILPEDMEGEEAVNYTILQNNIERSNVDMNQEMTKLMAAQSAFRSCSSALQIIDELNRKSVTQIGAI